MSLTNPQKYMVQGMLVSKVPVEEMAKDLELTEDEIMEYIEELGTTLAKIEENQEKPKKKKKGGPPVSPPMPTVREMLINKTQSGKKGISIMTEGVSARGDKVTPPHPEAAIEKAKDADQPQERSKKIQGSIFRPETGKIE
jgi:hypothetical protein